MGTTYQREDERADARVPAQGHRITDHQPYLDAIADEFNEPTPSDPRIPHPREVFTKIVTEITTATSDSGAAAARATQAKLAEMEQERISYRVNCVVASTP